MTIETASNPFFTNEEMASILQLDTDYLSDEGNMMKLERLSMSASAYLFDKTGYDWSADEPRDPSAYQIASDYVERKFYGITDISELYQRSIDADIDLLIKRYNKAKRKEEQEKATNGN